MNTASLNINRLLHLLTLYGVTKEELLQKINVGLKNLLKDNDIFSEEIKVSHLKKIDKIFNKGLAYYLDPKNPIISKEESIFFRKDDFNAKLNLGARLIVNKFEEDKISFSTLAKLSDFKLQRKIEVYKISDNPKIVATEIRKVLYPDFAFDRKTFLTNFITKLADYNIIVFEFIERHNTKEKANINGFFLTPNVIVLKRNQKALKREIFTLAHELGHYLLNEEEIDENINNEITHLSDLNKVEKWCNDFAYYFLIGKYNSDIEVLDMASSQNDYHTKIVESISKQTNISTIAIYTRLLLINKISPNVYKKITESIYNSIKDWELKEKGKQEIAKQKALDEGRKIIIPAIRPIISPLYLKTLQSSLYSGLIDEADFCKKLSIKPEKIDKYLI